MNPYLWWWWLLMMACCCPKSTRWGWEDWEGRGGGQREKRRDVLGERATVSVEWKQKRKQRRGRKNWSQVRERINESSVCTNALSPPLSLCLSLSVPHSLCVSLSLSDSCTRLHFVLSSSLSHDRSLVGSWAKVEDRVSCNTACKGTLQTLHLSPLTNISSITLSPSAKKCFASSRLMNYCIFKVKTISIWWRKPMKRWAFRFVPFFKKTKQQEGAGGVGYITAGEIQDVHFD